MHISVCVNKEVMYPCSQTRKGCWQKIQKIDTTLQKLLLCHSNTMSPL